MSLKDFNNSEKLKSFLSISKFYNEIKQMGLKKFWQTNSEFYVYRGRFLVLLIIYENLETVGFIS